MLLFIFSVSWRTAQLINTVPILPVLLKWLGLTFFHAFVFMSSNLDLRGVQSSRCPIVFCFLYREEKGRRAGETGEREGERVEGEGEGYDRSVPLTLVAWNVSSFNEVYMCFGSLYIFFFSTGSYEQLTSWVASRLLASFVITIIQCQLFLNSMDVWNFPSFWIPATNDDVTKSFTADQSGASL